MKYCSILIFLVFQLHPLKATACEEEFDIPQDTVLVHKVYTTCNLEPMAIEVKLPENSIKVDMSTVNTAKENVLEIRDILLLITGGIGLITLLVSFYNIKLSKINRLEDQFLDEIDGFWFKEIITPKVMNPVFKFIEDEFINFKNLPVLKDDVSSQSSSAIEQRLEALTESITKLEVAVNLLTSVPFGNEYHIGAKELFEQLQDHLICFLYDLDKLAFETEGGAVQVHDFQSIQDIFSHIQNGFLQLTSEYRTKTKREMSKNLLKQKFTK
jgi:hypothetical protein